MRLQHIMCSELIAGEIQTGDRVRVVAEANTITFLKSSPGEETGMTQRYEPVVAQAGKGEVMGALTAFVKTILGLNKRIAEPTVASSGLLGFRCRSCGYFVPSGGLGKIWTWVCPKCGAGGDPVVNRADQEGSMRERLNRMVLDGDREALGGLIAVCLKRADGGELLREAWVNCQKTRWHALASDLRGALEEFSKKPQQSVQSPQSLRNDELLRWIPLENGYIFLDPCEIHEVIGRGGMGVVYRGKHRRLGIDVAVKILDPRLVKTDSHAIDRFHREASVAARIHNANVVGVFDVLKNQGLHYIVMEFVSGGSARDRVRRLGPMEATKAAFVVCEAAHGLSEAHSQGIVHRDIKPDNILISRDGSVKVSDLGLVNEGLVSAGEASTGRAWARSPSTLTMAGSVFGTPFYMPPEQWVSAARVSTAADVWALGATLYYLLIGEDPNEKGEPVGLSPSPFPNVRSRARGTPKSIANIVATATSRNVADRYPTAGELAEVLTRVVGNASVDLRDG